MNESSDDWLKLSRRRVQIIVIIQLALFLLGSCLSYFVLIQEYRQSLISIDLSQFTLALIGSIGMSLLGSSIYYLRKIYKLCIQNKIINPDKSIPSHVIQQLGVTLYFVLRPLFSVPLSVLVVLAIKSGVFVMTNKNEALSEGFIYFCMVISFFCGFSSGELIRVVENYGTKIFDNMVRSGGVEKNESDKNQTI